MEKYAVEIAPAALSEIRAAFWYIREQSPANAEAWLRRLYRRIDTLEHMPHRCGIIRESIAFDEEIRELLHFSHRIIFTIDEQRRIVKVLTVRHAARDELQGDEF